jgi:5-methylthioribose kinase
MDFSKLIKSSATEANSFAKKNAMKFGIINDLQTARDGCKTKEARAMIEGLIVPMQKDLRKECATFDAKMSGIWKKAKGEKVPDDTQKELDNILKNSAKTIKSKSGSDIRHNSDTDHKQWVDLMSVSLGS